MSTQNERIADALMSTDNAFSLRKIDVETAERIIGGKVDRRRNYATNPTESNLYVWNRFTKNCRCCGSKCKLDGWIEYEQSVSEKNIAAILACFKSTPDTGYTRRQIMDMAGVSDNQAKYAIKNLTVQCKVELSDCVDQHKGGIGTRCYVYGNSQNRKPIENLQIKSVASGMWV